MMKVPTPLLVVLVCLIGCSERGPRVELDANARHFARSDDFGEYIGLYLYTLAQDGKLYWTHYSEKSLDKPVSHKAVGHWEEQEGKLTWHFSERKAVWTYVKNSAGVYVEEDGAYYVPVELIPIRVKDGRPFFVE